MNMNENENPENKPVRQFVKKWNRAFKREEWVYKELQTAKIYTEKNFLLERMIDVEHFIVVINDDELPPSEDCSCSSKHDMM